MPCGRQSHGSICQFSSRRETIPNHGRDGFYRFFRPWFSPPECSEGTPGSTRGDHGLTRVAGPVQPCAQYFFFHKGSAIDTLSVNPRQSPEVLRLMRQKYPSLLLTFITMILESTCSFSSAQS